MRHTRFSLFFIFIFVVGASAQIEQDTIFEYPFGEIGSTVPRGVYGSDDRRDVKDVSGIKDFVRATAVMIPKSNIRGNKVYGLSLRERLMNEFKTFNIDENVRFLDQPTCASCTGFLIAPDILVTAAHCVDNLLDAKKYVWVFDYTNELNYLSNSRSINLEPANMFEVVEVIKADLNNYKDIDYAFLRLDRKSNRAPYRFRTSGNVGLNSQVATIGSPSGLPLKYADNAMVIDNSPNNWFKNSIDTFPGNSGGPVFSMNGFIEGIHVRGAAIQLSDGSISSDYRYDEDCDCVKTIEFRKAEGTPGAQAHKISSVPADILKMAIYNNIEYALNNNLMDRFHAWSIYSWIFENDYTKQRGRFEWKAIDRNNSVALNYILQIASSQVYDEKGRNLLFYAIDKNNLEMLRVILKFNEFDVSLPDSSGEDAMFYAMRNSTIPIIKELQQHYIPVNTKDSNGNNLLHLSSRFGDFSLVKQLINNGVSARTRNNAGRTPEKYFKKNKTIKKYLKRARKGKL